MSTLANLDAYGGKLSWGGGVGNSKAPHPVCETCTAYVNPTGWSTDGLWSDVVVVVI